VGTPGVMDGTPVDFALTRLEAVDGGRLELEGTWTGVRGMRFVRPALVVHEDDRERTLLAVLEHKPWPAEDGHPWRAAFPWDGGDLDPARVELAVAPSIVVPLGAHDAADVAADPQSVLRSRLAEAEKRGRQLEAEVAFLRREREDRREEGKSTAARDAAARDAAARDAAARDAQRHEQARQERDAARAEQEHAVERERKAERAREAAAQDREQLAAELQTVRDRLAAAEADRDRALAVPAGVVSLSARPERRHARVAVRADWAARIAAILALLVLLVLAITFLKVL
jgi:DNA repair exonuclease SbcCD ATPase subunit